MKASFQDILLFIPLYQLTFLTPLPKEKIYYETITSSSSNQWFEISTLLVLDSEEEWSKLSDKELVNQIIQDSNLTGIVICTQNEIKIDEDCLLLMRECRVPIVQVEDSNVLSLFHQMNIQHHYFGQLSVELNGFMNKGFMNIASNLSTALETPFLYFDENNQLLWQIGSQIEIEKAIQWIKYNYREATAPNLFLSAQKPVNDANQTANCYEQYGINIAGQIHLILVTFGDLNDWQKMMIDKFIGLTALFFQTEEMFREQQDRMKEHFVYDLLYHKFESKKVMVKQGKAWGWNLERPHHLFVIDFVLTEDLMTNLDWMNEIIVHLETQASQLNDGIILFPFQDQLVVLLRDDENLIPSERKNFVFEITALIEKELSSYCSGCQFYIGIGKWYQDSVNLNKSYQEAKMALQYGKVWFENKHIFHINDLGVFHLIIHLHKEILYDYCQEYLSSLIESDEKHGTEYLKTLNAYFQHQGIITEVSDALYIHPNTLRNRLKKIEDLTGVQLQNTVEFLNLMVAVKINYSMSF